VDDADHDSQREADISEDWELSEYDETDDDDGNFYIGTDKETRWRKTQIAPRAKTRGKNNVKKKKIPGPTSHARDASTKLEAYLKIMDIDIVDEIVKCTNKYMHGIRHKFARECGCTGTSRSEIMALLGAPLFDLYKERTSRQCKRTLDCRWHWRSNIESVHELRPLLIFTSVHTFG